MADLVTNYYCDEVRMNLLHVKVTVSLVNITIQQVINYCIFPKYGPGVNYFQMASDQALN